MRAVSVRSAGRVVLVLLAWPAAAQAQAGLSPLPGAGECRFAGSGTVMHLESSCLTETSIVIPDGMTLDGHGHAIVAMDPVEGGFEGGVVVARGATASVINTVVTVAPLSGSCRRGAERLRGIYFEGASGVIRNNTVDEVHRAACGGEGVGIEVRNPGADGPRTTVEITGNRVTRYRKSGIVLHGHLEAFVSLNEIGAAAFQDAVTVNALQVGPGASARVTANTITATASAGDAAAGTGVLLIDAAPGTIVSRNLVLGGDVGIYVLSSGALVEDNEVADAGPDGAYDVGIVNLGEDNVVSNNTIRGYQTRYYGLELAVRSPASQIE